MTLTREQTRALIEQCVFSVGGPSKFSRKFDIAEGYVRNVVKGRTAPGPRISRIVGMTKAEDRWVKL